MADDGGQKVGDPLGHRYAVAVLAAVGGHGVVDNPIDAGSELRPIPFVGAANRHSVKALSDGKDDPSTT